MSAERIILRYSDRERDTIAAHKEIVENAGRVWWGWWKKMDENMPPAGVLPYGPLNPPLEVGLLQRKPDEAYWMATCTAIVAVDGEPLASPEAKLTPEYYREDPFPAWFQFTEFQQLDRDSFLEVFPEVPEANATLYWVDESKNGGQLRPELQPPRVLDTNGNGVLHLSDLHFGELHAFGEGWEADGSMVKVVADQIEESDVDIGVVVVSGDLITKAKHDDYPQVAEALTTLLDRLELTKDHIVIVPGNHDINLDDALDKGTRRYAHESGFRRFMKQFYGGEIEEIESLTRYGTPDGWTLAFVGLNSVRLRDEETKDFGYVGHRSEPWFRRLRELNEGASSSELVENRNLNFLVLHHHLLPATREAPKSTPVSVTVDAARIVEDCQDSGVHVALHGHQHYPFIASTSRVPSGEEGGAIRDDAPLWVIGGGSCGARAEALPDQLRENSYGVYTPTDEGLHVIVEQYNPSQGPRTFQEVTLPVADSR